MRVEQIRAFLEQHDIKLLIEDEDLEKVYSKCHSSGRKDLTEYLLACGVQPDEYMKTIPDRFLDNSTIQSYHIASGVEIISFNAFRWCENLTEVTIPNTVKMITGNTFESCHSLKSIIIPDSVTFLGCDLFRGCTNLERAVIGAGAKVLPMNMFLDCTNLHDVTIGKNVTTIGESVFYGCENLVSIKIPKNVTKIEDYAFSSCWNLTDIYFEGTTEVWKSFHPNIIESDKIVTVHCADGNIVID